MQEGIFKVTIGEQVRGKDEKRKMGLNLNELILDGVRGESEARKEAGLIALPLRTGTFDEVIRQEKPLKAHFVDTIDKIQQRIRAHLIIANLACRFVSRRNHRLITHRSQHFLIEQEALLWLNFHTIHDRE